MERFEGHMADPAALGMVVEESPEFQDSDFEEGDDSVSNPADRVEGPVSTDDPVRVYLREMGSVRLLKREGEIGLARRMETGKLRMRKALSRGLGSGQAGGSAEGGGRRLASSRDCRNFAGGFFSI